MRLLHSTQMPMRMKKQLLVLYQIMGSNLVILFFFFFLFFRNTCQQQQQQQSLPLNSRAEWAALLQLRSSLGLRTKDWPVKSDPCLTWIGVQCQDGSVIGINISGFKRTRNGNENPRFSVDSIANFTKLVSFNASGFKLPGSIPDWLGFKLQTLRLLDLRFCEIRGDIPFSIGNLSSLSELYLSNNNLTGTIPSSFGLLSQISVLDLSRNLLTGVIPEEFGNLISLRYLNLSSNSLSSCIPTQLGKLTSLVVLDLSSNRFSGHMPMEIGNLRNLKRMVVHDNNFTGDLPDALWSLPVLSFVDASCNNIIGSLPNISSNINATMELLNLSHNMFYGVLTCVLRRVGSVDLSYNYFQGEIPDYARDVAFLDRNCFQGCLSQRNVKECAAFYSMKGLAFDNFGLSNGTLAPILLEHKSNHRVFILAVIFGSLGLIVLFAILVILLIIRCCKKRKITHSTGIRLEPISTERASLNLSGLGEVFAYEKIVAATSDFNDANLIKTGHSGDIFKGVLEGGIHVIVKRSDVHSGKNRRTVELDFFSKISHHRIVPLLGHCLENEKEKFLIYKYMPKGDLSSSLYRKKDYNDDSIKSLDWITRLKVAIGAAQGLSYLHHECFPPLVHRDIQASSILLDDKYEVRLGSLSEACTQKSDCRSNRITELLRLPQPSEQGVANATCAYDVYCFGKVLLELVTGKTGISATSDSIAKDLLEDILPYISIYNKELVTDIMDPSLIVDEDLLEEVWAMAVIAKSCLNPKPSRRPLMRFILKALENPLKVVREETTSSTKFRMSSFRGYRNGRWQHSFPRQPARKAEGSETGSQFQDGVDRCMTIRSQDEERLKD